jgi:hypothetical protein
MARSGASAVSFVLPDIMQRAHQIAVLARHVAQPAASSAVRRQRIQHGVEHKNRFGESRHITVTLSDAVMARSHIAIGRSG